MKRPLLVIGLAFFLSTAAALLFGDNFAAAVGAFLLLSLPAAFFFLRQGERGPACAVLLAAALAMGNVLAQDVLFVRPVTALAGKTVLLSGRVTGIAHYGAVSRYELEASIPLREGGSLRAKVSAAHFGPLPTRVNETLQGAVKLETQKLGGQYRFYYLSSRALLEGIFVGEPRIYPAQETPRTPGYWASGLREALIAQNRRLMPPQGADVVNAMLLGRQELLDDSTVAAFKRAGISHLTAVSGFHVSLITSLLMGVLQALGVGRKRSALFALPLMGLFMAVAGFTPSVLRAGLMTGLCLGALLLGRQYDPPSAWGFSMLTILAVNPYSALDVGFLLSFGATAGIVFLAGPLYGALRRRLEARGAAPGRVAAALVQGFSVSLAAYAFTLPVMLYTFNTVSVVGVLASTVIMPLASLMLWCAALCLAISAVPLLLPLAGLLDIFTTVLARMVVLLAKAFAALPFAAASVRHEPIKLLLAAFYLLGLALVALGAGRRLKLECGAVAAVVLLTAGASAALMDRGTLEVAVFERADAALLISGGRAALVGYPQTAAAGKRMEEYLKSRGIGAIDLAVSTAASNAEAQGAVALFADVPVQMAVLPAQGRDTAGLRQGLAGAGKVLQSGPPMRLAALGTQLELIPCACGYACKIGAGTQCLLKTNENCDIIGASVGALFTIRGWEPEGPGGPGEEAALDGRARVSRWEEGVTIYTMRK